ncbi:MAG TPA: class I SAM-dependent methyltransferase [Syntrophales bacterium]|jgi:ubiquinone/menaquinone biosynthesis C-methylase UbiE|nr:class I SAM-dependent methyltransferase [Syntrophales bacterium]HOX93646.1 class I SAM-dependent methyltransferase [Syntrophales bacterium]HPI57392.1 class I SAM-dependent methyltransferase [Syntrophales bacterium]HPN25456.1 class I SAM-dependent methyltransferase [Syntrophales bacterium]HQM29938.1 class I SAM-dependent methyltransferase [Syntrophales bacterium]
MSRTESIRNIYEKKFFTSKPSLSSHDVQLQYILHYLTRDVNLKILDAGCGNGRYALHLSVLGFKNIKALDLFDRIETKGLFQYCKASIDHLPFCKEYFDFIYCNSVIFYLEQPEKGIKEFHRVLKQGGTVIITAHTKYSLFTLLRIIKRALNAPSVEHLNGIKFYSAHQYKKMFENMGFKIVRIDGYRLSALAYPVYKKFQIYLSVNFGIILPNYIQKGVTKNKCFASIKSIFGYHSILVAQK